MWDDLVCTRQQLIYIHELGTKYTEIVYNIHINGNMMVIAVYTHIVANKYCCAYLIYMAILPILLLIYIDDNSIAINTYIHNNNCNCVHYGYCCVYVYMTITVTTCIMVIAMYICINGNQIVHQYIYTWQ